LEGHGTHVTGIIDATYGNGKGGSGVASGHQNDLVRVLTVGASENGEDFTSLDLVQAVRYAADQDVRVINMSVTGYERDRLWERSIKEAFYEKGILFVAASGNGDVDMQTTPSDLREVIAVNASNADNTALYWSDYGWRKEITAPGNSILSTLPGDRYGLMSGTSMASPVVAGVAALMLDVRPELTPDQVRNILCATTSQQGRFVPETTAYGIVDAQKAVQAALDADTSVPVESLNLKVNKGKPIELNAGDDTGLMALSLPAESLAQISWSSSDPDVVEVDQYGNLLAKAEGEATITVSSGERKDTCAVRVHPSVPATELTIGGAPEDGQLEVGEEATLEGNIAPEDVTNREVIWSSDNSDVIVCFDEGLVRALAPGKATITAETFDGKLKATITLVVKPMATRLQFTRTIPWMFVGEKGMFAGRLLNKSGKADVAHREIIWSSSNRRIAQVDRKTGRVSALRTGKFFVKARNHDETAVATRQVIVAKKRYAGKADYALCQSAKSRKSVTIRWKKIPVAAGYQIQQKVKTGRKTWKWKNVRSVKGSVCTAQFRGKGQKTFRVRAYYRKSGKTRYFGWSNQVPTKPGKTRKAGKP
ncbi:MAG: S8 family serine peptidase, partial [Eubacterium sp.]|nr:S8 family serine peptidase [Eubacterium sp.]